MKIKTIIILIGIIALIGSVIYIKQLKSENKRLTNNQETLFSENTQFKVRDSLRVTQVNQLELKISELEKYRAEDLELIKDLKISKSSLESIITANTETIKSLRASLHDSIRIDTITNQIDTLKCFDYKSKWTDVAGCFNGNTVDLAIKNRESLKVISHLQKKKFWFIKLPIWLFGYKTKQISIVSENPATSISNIEYISIKN